MFDPKSIRKGAEKAPRKVVIYGPPKMGKSTLAAASRNALLIPTEDRVKHITCAKTDVVENFSNVLEIMEYISTGDTGYETVIFDTLDWMEPMIHKAVCDRKNFKSLIDDNNKETNFGRGLKFHAVEGWKNFLTNCDALRETAGVNIILVAHSAIEKVTPPDAESYDRYTMKLDKNAVAVVEEWADVIGFYNHEIIVKKEDAGFGKKAGKAMNLDNNRVLNTQASAPAWISGNSFGLPDFNVTPDSLSDIMDIMLGYVSWPDMLPITEAQKTKKK